MTTIKVAREFGFEVTCYEKSPHYGGLWHYTDDKHQANPGEDDFYPSVMRTTILNTSKELSAFSDFPPPPKLPNFMKHSLYMNYIDSYVKHFQLEQHLRLSHEILSCKLQLSPNSIKPDDNNNNINCDDNANNCNGNATKTDTSSIKSGTQIKWDIEVKDRKTGEIIRKQFDRLIVATGHHNTPYTPTLPGQQQFKGLIIHSGRVKDILTDNRFIDKNVLIIGLANSACDAANDLAIVSNKCIVSCHRGTWFLPRLVPGSKLIGYDQELKCRWSHFFGKHLPTFVSDLKVTRMAKNCTNHDMLGLRAKHKPSELVPSINDMFPYRIFTGGVILKSSLLKLTEFGAIFENEPDIEHPIDCVIVATGYQAKMDFLDEQELGLRSAQQDDEFDLFLNIFAPRLSLPAGQLDQLISASHDDKYNDILLTKLQRDAIKSLAFTGLVQPSGSIAVIAELQARLICSIFSAKIDLPSVEKMFKFNQKAIQKRQKSIRSHSRDQIVDDWIAYQDRLATFLGCKPNLMKLFITDRPLWKQLIYGPSVAYQYRLIGPGKWPEARKTILDVPNRMLMGINEGQNEALYKTRRKRLHDTSKKTK